MVIEDGPEQLFIGDAAYTKDIFENFEDFPVERLTGQADDVDATDAIHFCHDTRVVHPHRH
ncbi:MAG: hypothetical protein E6J29_09905 [Chloroflexi bacterium]|nr:MAG: hypothetical protein E6J29_09905 [Chloroflexota bacterium]